MSPRASWWIVGFVALGWALRAVWPLADPAARLSWSSGIYTDPASVTHAARNAALFGEWIRDASRDLIFFPAINATTWIAYEIFGVSRLVAQQLAAGSGALGLGLVAAAAARRAPRAGVLSAAVLACCAWLVMFSRVPVAENFVVVFLGGASLLAGADSNRARLLAGFLAAAAVAFGKFHAIAFLPALALFVVLRERSPRALLAPAAGVGVALVAWVVLVALPFRERIAEHLAESPNLYGSAAFLRSPLAAAAEVLRTIGSSWLFHRIPILGPLGVWFALWTLVDRDARRRRLENGTALFALWFVASWAYTTLLPYKAPRYFVLSAVPLLVCAACQLAELFDRATPRWRRPHRIGEWSAVGAWIFATSYAAVEATRHYLTILRDAFAIPRSASFVSMHGWLDAATHSLFGMRIAVILALALSALGALVLRRFAARPGEGARSSRWSGTRVAGGLLAVSLAISAGQYAWWATHRTYAIEESKASLVTLVGPDAVVLGAFAPLLTQDSRLVAVPQFGAARISPIAEHGVTHIVLGLPGDDARFEEAHPGLLDELAPVRGWPLRTRHLRSIELHALPTEGRASPSGYTPTAFERGARALAQERYEEALARFAEFRTSGARAVPDVPSLEARCLYGLGRVAEARARLEEAIRLRPTNPSDHYNLGNLLLREGNVERARELWTRGLELDPFDETMSEALAGLLP